MRPGGTDALYRAALAAGHQHYARIEVWSGLGKQLQQLVPDHLRGDQGGLVYLPGTALSATLTSQVVENVSMQVPISLYPTDTNGGLLYPYGNELRIWFGIRMPDGSLRYTWQVFRGKIQAVLENEDAGTCTVQAADRWQDVIDAGFVSPQNSQPGTELAGEFRRLILGAVPDAEFGPFDDIAQPTPALSWEFGRASGLEEMASSVGALGYCLGDGRFVLRKYPWGLPTPPVVTLHDGPGGEILRSNRQRSRAGMANVVTMVGERLNGDEPVFATAADNNPASLTRIGGGFGTKSLLLRRQTPATQGGAEQGARARLRTAISPTEQWTWSTSPDGAVELGDVVRLAAKSTTAIQVVQSFTLPLDLQGEMIVQGRSQVIGTIEEGSM